MKSDASVADSESLDSRAHRGAVWSGINMLMTKLAGIAVTIVVVRIVSPHDFGVFAAALIVHTIVSSFAELGVASCVARRDLSLDDHAPTVAAISLISGTVFALIVFGFAEPIAAAFGAADAKGPVQVLSICVFLTGFFAVPGAMMTREFRQDRLFIANLVAFVPANGLLILLALDGNGALAFAWSRVAGQLFVGLVIILTPQRFYWPRINRGKLRPILKFGLPLAGANLINYTLLNADFAFISRILGPAVLGIYVLAFNIASWSSSVLGSTINSVAMTAFSESGLEATHLRDRLARWTRLTALVACPIAAMTAVLSTDIVVGLYGEKWAEAGPVLAVLGIYGAMFTTSLLLSNLLVARGQSWRVLLVQAGWLAALVPGLWLGVSQFGVLGAAWVHVGVIACLVLPLYLWMLRSAVEDLPGLLFRAAAGPLLAAIAAAGAAYAVILPISGSWWRIAAAALTGLFIYMATALPLAREVWGGANTRLAPLFSTYDSLLARFAKIRRRST